MGNNCCSTNRVKLPEMENIVIDENIVVSSRSNYQMQLKSKYIDDELIALNSRKEEFYDQILTDAPTADSGPDIDTAVLYNLKFEIQTKEVAWRLAQIVYNHKQYSQFAIYLIVNDQSIYQGEWKNGQKHGNGKQQWLDGSFYDGEWKSNLQDGNGFFIHPDGEIYEGAFIQGKADGLGKYTQKDGSTYIGTWLNNQYHGRGIENWVGNIYEGDYQFNQKHGKGKFTWVDGSKYEGDMLKNDIQGKGIYEWFDGRKYEGDWFANKMHGQGRFVWGDGKLYEGQYFNGKKEGYGNFQWSNGQLYKGNWKNGLQHGEGIMIINGLSAKGFWEEGNILQWIVDETPSIPQLVEEVSFSKDQNSNNQQ